MVNDHRSQGMAIKSYERHDKRYLSQMNPSLQGH